MKDLGEDQLLFLVYQLLKSRYDSGYIPDHLKENEAKQKQPKEELKQAYIEKIIENQKPAQERKTPALPPVQNLS